MRMASGELWTTSRGAGGRALLAKPRAEREKLHEQGLIVKYFNGTTYKLLGYWKH